MNPQIESSDPEPAEPRTDSENFDSALDVGRRTTAQLITRTPTLSRRYLPIGVLDAGAADATWIGAISMADGMAWNWI